MHRDCQATNNHALAQVALPPLLERSHGAATVRIAVVDGPVSRAAEQQFTRDVRRLGSPAVHAAIGAARDHGTFVTSLLAATRSAPVPGICPGCTIMLRPVFDDRHGGRQVRAATAHGLAEAIGDALDARAHVINLSLAVTHSHPAGERELLDVLDLAAHKGTLVVAAAGNQGTIGGSVLLRHPWVIPVAGCERGHPTAESNLGRSIGRGVMAPAAMIMSLGAAGTPVVGGGTSIAAAFVTGTIGLLWSEHVTASAAQIRASLSNPHMRSSRRIIPPLLNAWRSHQLLTRELARTDTQNDHNRISLSSK
jgi:subtilisin family serine protease